MLCQICQDTIQRAVRTWHRAYNSRGDEVYDPLYIHHPTLRSLWESLFTKCYICNLFCARLSPWARDLVLARLDTPSALGWDGGLQLGEGDWTPIMTQLELLPHDLESGDLEDRKRVQNYLCVVRLAEDHVNYQFKVDDEKAEEIGIRFILDGTPAGLADEKVETTRSPEVFSLASSWISNCVAGHERCRSSSSNGGWYPTRLLDLHPPGLQSDWICLVETSETIPNGSYMTLSHCWGKVDHLTLTKASYDEFCRGISTNRLRQIFQDAIDTVRMLGCRYIWIDALCILQDKDDLSDWTREAPRMQEVYANSLCNISALDAPDGSHSLFHNRDPEYLCPPTVSVAAADDSGAGLPVESLVLHDQGFWEHEVSNAILHTRAWVVQERILAPRVLHFGDRQILWECAEKNAAEIYPNGLPFFIPNKSAKSLAPSPGNDLNLKPSPYLTWVDIIETYSKCNITMPQDKLIACAGLAMSIAQTSNNDEYIAGLWRHHLEFQLLWEVATDHFTEQREIGDTSYAAEYRAPSWSWAFLDGAVKFPKSLEGRSLVKIEDVRCSYATTGNKYGAVVSASLRLTGILKAIEILEPWPPTGRIAQRWRIHMRNADSHDLDHPKFSVDVVRQNFRLANAWGSLFMMPIVQAGSVLRALLLLLVDPVDGIYVRIGVATWGPVWREEDERETAKMVEVLREDGTGANGEYPCVGYQNGLYSIILE